MEDGHLTIDMVVDAVATDSRLALSWARPNADQKF